MIQRRVRVVNFSSVCSSRERDIFIDNLLVRIHFIIVMIRWTGLAPWEFELPFHTAGFEGKYGKI